MKMKTKCQECGGSDLQWHSSVTNKSDVVDGRLRAHDLDVLFYVGCNDCSATVQRATGDQIARHLNEAAAQVAPAAPVVDALPQAARDVLDERRRQVGVEGRTAEHDDGYQGFELALAAAWYAIPPFTRNGLDANDMGLWPIGWLSATFKPGDRRRELVKSGALAIAEVERLDRAAAQAAAKGAA